MIKNLDNPKNLIEHHAYVAASSLMISSKPSVQWYVERGKEIPEYQLPGRYIQRLSVEQRQILSQLKSEDMFPPDLSIIRYMDKRESNTLFSLIRRHVPNLEEFDKKIIH